jgi:mono/diheme cytochrome c family protein
MSMIRYAMIGAVALMSNAAVAETPAERGAYLVNTVMTCQNCHTPKGPGGVPQLDKDLSGGLTFDEPPFKVTASNITPDKETGIGSWSDAEIKKSLVQGVRPNGVPLAAVMPTGFYGMLTPGDLNAIVAYLRTLKPVSNRVPDPVYKINVPRQVAPYADKPFDVTDFRVKEKKGLYLVTIAHCMECHTPFAKSGGIDFTNSLGKGGREFPGPWGVSVARNITSHKEKGIGGWTDAEIKRAITQGISRDGSRLKPPMGYPFYAKMTDTDLDAMVAYLRHVPPLE